ncbi:MAG: GNAT family N-acetyltransferase [Chitinophagales bacterium]|nr:GNAT family N-acetyltransferase [Chitinophagales bacterium]
MKKDYTYQFVSREEFWAVFKNLRKEVFGKTFSVDTNMLLSEKEKQKVKTLADNYAPKETLALLCKDKDKVVAWSYGFQTKVDTFYMMNSGVLEDYRKQGIYTHMLELVVGKAKEMGFQKIDSRHNMTNNAVIIPKLKFGFKISGFELEPTYGTLVHLAYYTNPKIDSLLSVRDGSTLPEKEDFKHLF